MRQPLLEDIKKKAEPLLRSHDVEFAAVFGSAARGQAHDHSDIDIIVRYAKAKSLFDVVGLSQELSETLGRKVDIVSERFVHPHLKKSIIGDLQIVYGQRRYL